MFDGTPGHPPPFANRLLAALPRDVYAGIEPRLVALRTDQGDVLLHPGQPIDRVYFPTAGLFSLLVLETRGAAVEAMVVGREGMLGAALVLDQTTSAFEEVSQIEGSALSLPAEDLRQILAQDPASCALVLRYVGALLTATARSAACNRLHTTEQRLARWLLQVRDRIDSDVFHLTQEFLGHMLGVRRPTVTLATAELERAGLISHRRGRIRILDGAGLETAACEDYAAVRAAYAGLVTADGRTTVA